MVTKTDSGVLWEDCRDLWTNFQKIQLPAIPKAALLSILKSTRNSIVSLRYDYEFNLDPVENNVLKKIHETGKCIISGQKVLLKLNNNQKNSKDYLNYIISFDGKVKRIVDFAVDENLPNASIDNIVSLDQFYPMNSLLAALAFLDTKIYWERSEPYYDLITFLEEGGGIILEHVEEYEGFKCLVITDATYRFLVCPEKNFSVVQKECYRTDFSDGHLVRNRTNLVRFDGFREYNNSLWFPEKCIDESFSEEKLTVVQSVVFRNVEVNIGIEDNTFSDIIPDNAIVFDGVKGLAYKQSDSLSIDSLLKETVKSKRVFIYRYISIISGLVLIFIVLVIKYRLYLKDKQERENKTEEETK